MTHPVDARFIAGDPIIYHRSNTRSLQITLLAVATLASLFSMMILPWQLSIPLSAVLIGSALIFSIALENYADGPIIAPSFTPPPLIHEHYHISERPAVIIDTRPRAPVGRSHYIPRLWQPTPPPVPMHIPSGPRAPVGIRNVGNGCFGSNLYTPPSTSGPLSLFAPRASVGHR